MTCAGKRLFPTKSAARRHARQYTTVTSPYYCKSCHAWHLTSGKPKRAYEKRNVCPDWPLDRKTT